MVSVRELVFAVVVAAAVQQMMAATSTAKMATSTAKKMTTTMTTTSTAKKMTTTMTAKIPTMAPTTKITTTTTEDDHDPCDPVCPSGTCDGPQHASKPECAECAKCQCPQMGTEADCSQMSGMCVWSSGACKGDATTATTTLGAATIYTGSMTLQFADAQAFVDSPNAKTVMQHSIAASNQDISQNMVTVTNIAVARRLSAKPRVLTAGGVKVDYTVTYPPGTSIPVLTASSFNTTTLIEAVQTKANELGISVTVTSVTVDEPTAGAPMSTTTMVTATTGSTDLTDGATASTGLLALVSAVVMGAFAA